MGQHFHVFGERFPQLARSSANGSGPPRRIGCTGLSKLGRSIRPFSTTDMTSRQALADDNVLTAYLPPILNRSTVAIPGATLERLAPRSGGGRLMLTSNPWRQAVQAPGLGSVQPVCDQLESAWTFRLAALRRELAD